MKSTLANKLYHSTLAGVASVGLVIVATGCEEPLPERVKIHQSGQVLEEDKTRKAGQDIGSRVMEVEMEITEVQFGQVSYRCNPKMEGQVVGNHPFQYVIGKSGEGKDRVFIYPFSMPILKKNVSFKADPLSRGAISVEHFLKEYVRTDASLESLNYDIPADGIIQVGSIMYREGK